MLVSAMSDNSLACCCLTHEQLEIASSVTLWLCGMRARLHTTTWGWGKLMDRVDSAKGGGLQRHLKAGMHLWSAGCFLLIWKKPQKPNEKIPHSAHSQKKTQTTQWTFGGVHMQKLFFPLCLHKKKAHYLSQSSTLSRRDTVMSFEQS